MKIKVLCVIAIIFFMGNGIAWAGNNTGVQTSIMAAGLVLMLIPPIANMSFDEPMDPLPSASLYVGGGLVFLAGAIWFIVDLVTDDDNDYSSYNNYSERKNKNPFRNLSFGFTSKDVFVGANFRY